MIEESALNQTLEDLGISSGQLIMMETTSIDISPPERPYGSSGALSRSLARKFVVVPLTLKERNHARLELFTYQQYGW